MLTIGAVLLAAGFSRRFGAGDKRLAPFRGTTIATSTATLYVAAFAEVRVVIRADDEALSTLLSQLPATNISLCTTEEAHLGLGHSLASGCANLEWDWAFVGLLDMPYVRRETLNTLIDACARAQDTRTTIIQPRYKEQPGHPVGFQRAHFQALSELRGDVGAKSIVEQHHKHIEFVDTGDRGVIDDIDRPSDLTH